MMRIISVGLIFFLICFSNLPTTAHASSPSVWDSVTLCSYSWFDKQDKWRKDLEADPQDPAYTYQAHTWTEEDCSNGLPQAGYVAIGQSINLKGIASQAECGVTEGNLYNQPTHNGSDTGTLKCLFFNPQLADSTTPELVLCESPWGYGELGTGWRTHEWTQADCEQGSSTTLLANLTGTEKRFSQGINGVGTSAQTDCGPAYVEDPANPNEPPILDPDMFGHHFNHPTKMGLTNRIVKCLYFNPVSLGGNTRPPMVFCSATFSNNVTGLREHAWGQNDCTGGTVLNSATGSYELHAGYAGIGQAINGNGTLGQVECFTSKVTHYNDASFAGATNGVANCIFVLPPKYLQDTPSSTVAYTYDLDDDGNNDTNLSLVNCSAVATSTCMSIVSNLMNNEQALEVELYTGAIEKPFTNGNEISESLATNFDIKDRFRLIGDHTGDGIQEIFIHYAFEAPNVHNNNPLPVISIVDSLGGKRLVDQPFPDPLDLPSYAPNGTSVKSPVQYYTYAKSTGSSNSGQVKSPNGKRYPFLAPGYEAYGDWEYVCLFRPTLPDKQGKCEPGFVEISMSTYLRSAPTNPGLRDSGVIQHDLNGDGWEDISLIYRFGYASLDTKNVVQFLSPAPTFDVFPGTVTQPEPRQTELNDAAAVWSEFHGGRFYGINKAITTTNGDKRILVITGEAVHPGALSDVQCGVSRYLAVVETSINNGTFEQDLLWANYRGHYSTIHRYPNTPGKILAWEGDLVNECVNYPSDGVANVEGTDAVVFNYFSVDYSSVAKPIDCTPYQNEGSSSCKIALAGQAGTWGFQALNLENGHGVTGGTGIYIWGMSDKLLGNGEMAYIAEHVPAGSPFNFTSTSNPIHVYTHQGGGFVSHGTIPGNTRPELMKQFHTDFITSGDQSRIYDLILEDRNNDGFMDFQLTDSTWAAVVETAPDQYQVQTFP